MLVPQAGVMKWQTCQTQNLVRRKLRVGSSPTAGIFCDQNRLYICRRCCRKQLDAIENSKAAEAVKV